MRDDRSTDPGALFLQRSAYFLESQYLPKLRRCLEQLDEGAIWARANEESNAIGNLLLHLAGNLRQWVVSGVGGEADRRDRASEFAARAGLERAALVSAIDRAVHDAARVLRSFPPERLTEEVHIQGRDTTALGAIYHAVEHFSMHTGQIILLTKQMTGRSLDFYRLEDGIPRENF